MQAVELPAENPLTLKKIPAIHDRSFFYLFNFITYFIDNNTNHVKHVNTNTDLKS